MAGLGWTTDGSSKWKKGENGRFASAARREGMPSYLSYLSKSSNLPKHTILPLVNERSGTTL
jgi:hypothetical protein